jgi:3'-5' exoribonuclease
VREQKSYFYDVIPIIYDITDERRSEILEEFPVPALPTKGLFFDIDKEEKGNVVSTRLLLNEMTVQTTKTNKEFLKMTFSNNQGTIQAKMWDNQGAVAKHQPLLESYSIFDVEGIIDEFRGFKSITVNRLTPSEEDVDPFAYLPYTKQNLEEITVELFAYLDELAPAYHELTHKLMKRFWDVFSISPAAKGFHHNYLGGLLKHTVGLMRFCRYIVKQEADPFQAVMKLIAVVEKAHKRELWENFKTEGGGGKLVWKDTIDHLYQMLHRMMDYHEDPLHEDALLTSILFHDVGKILEYDFAGKTYGAFEYLYPHAAKTSLEHRKETGITMDELGKLVGHIPYGALLLTKLTEEIKSELSLEEIHLITHCILCHHGLPEWGASAKPQTLEGYLIHFVDFLDSRYENTEAVK